METVSFICVPGAPAIPGLTFRPFRGEADYPVMVAILDACKAYKHDGVPRREMIPLLARRFPWIYAPNLYDVRYHPDGTIAGLVPKVDGLPRQITRCTTPDFEDVNRDRDHAWVPAGLSVLSRRLHEAAVAIPQRRSHRRHRGTGVSRDRPSRDRAVVAFDRRLSAPA